MSRSTSRHLAIHAGSNRLLFLAPLVLLLTACQHNAILPAASQNKAPQEQAQIASQVTVSNVPKQTSTNLHEPILSTLADTNDQNEETTTAGANETSSTQAQISYQSDLQEQYQEDPTAAKLLAKPYPIEPVSRPQESQSEQVLILPDTNVPTIENNLTKPHTLQQLVVISPASELTDYAQVESLAEIAPEPKLEPKLEPKPEPEPEPAPILDLWQITVASYALPAGKQTPEVEKRIQTHDAWYRKHTTYMQRVTKRSSRYYHYVLNQIMAAGLPTELALLPIVESGFDPFAYSHGRAAGAWQFIPSTGRMFGLKQTWWYDGRRDVVASTEAAIKYLTQLNTRFDGDWLLAIAAYNGGPGTVSKAIRANKKAGLATDYWSLKLPKETMHYVPKLLGLSQVVADHAGTEKITSVANQNFFQIVDTGSQIDLAQAADLADISVAEIYLLNPAYNQWATDPDGPHRLLVPSDVAGKFRQDLAKLPPEQRVAWQRYIIQPGDSLLKLSKQHHVSVDLIRSLNSLQGNIIVAGKPLMIPVASKNAEAYSLSAAQRVLKRQQQLSKINASHRIEHKVASGESLWTISKKYKVTIKQVVSWNKIGTNSLLQIGQKLNIWPRVASTKLTNGSRQVVKKLTYKVRSGDNLSRIAWRFNITVKDIQRWNSDLKKYLQPGQKLTLYVDVTKARG